MMSSLPPPPPPPPPPHAPHGASLRGDGGAGSASGSAEPPASPSAPATPARQGPAAGLAALGDKLGGKLGDAWGKFKDLGAEEEPAAAPVNDDHLYADGAVFGKPRATAYFDTVWQTDPPRMLRYRPTVLHSYGWIPGLIPRNFKGTVLRDPHLVLQIVFLWLWMLFIRNTGLYAALRDQKVFVLFFGTPYMAAILNLCMVITFTLGLFVTLVVNRWWDIRVNYGVARSLSIELAYIVSTNMRATKGASGATAAAAEASGAQNAFARSELMRYLNFAHLLLICDAQKAEKGDFADSPDKRLGRWLRRNVARVPVLRQLLTLEAGLDSGLSGLGDVMGNPRAMLRSLQQVSVGIVSGVVGAVNDVSSAFRAVKTGHLRMDDMGLEQAAAARERAAAARSAAAEIDFQQFYVMGLVTPEEWALIRAAERDGIPSWRTVYNWVAALMADAVVEGRMDERVATAGGMQAMCMEIRNAGGRVFTMMNTQLPFTYVHLVSFICHTYLFIIATYFGFILAIGIPGINWVIDVNDEERSAHWSGNLYTHHTQNGEKDGDGPLMTSLIFLIVAFACTIIQGLLSMHSLLENPFGTHPCKFPLRAYNIDHIRQTRAMLREPAEREPGTIRQVFVSKLAPPSSDSVPQTPRAPGAPSGDGLDARHGRAATDGGADSLAGALGGTPNALGGGATACALEGDAAANALGVDDGRQARIHFVDGKEEQMHTDVQAPSNNASIF